MLHVAQCAGKRVAAQGCEQRLHLVQHVAAAVLLGDGASDFIGKRDKIAMYLDPSPGVTLTESY
jgi:hypothetical protein